MDEFDRGSLKLAREEISRVMDDLDEGSKAYRNLDDAIQSIDEAIDDDSVEPQTSVEDWK